MSRLRALELAVATYSVPASTDDVIKTATKFAEFLGDESKPASTGRRTAQSKAPDAPLADSPPAVKEEVQTAAPTPPAAKEEVKTAPAATKPAAPAAPAGDVEVREAVGKLAANAKAGGAKKAREILAKYGATNITTIKAEHYAKVVADVNEALEAAAIAA